MKRAIWVAALTVAGLLLVCPLAAAPKQPVVVVHGPTVVAFFPPVTPAELNAHPDTNEALADFQYYATKVRKPLQDAGVDFKEIYALSFNVQRGTRVTTFHPGKADVGYYFIAPGKTPRIEYGVLTNDDILHDATEYFRISK